MWFAETSYNILEAFYYGRAFAITLNRRLGEAMVEVVSEVSKQLAERPERIKEFQQEIELLAQQEMTAEKLLESPTSTSSTGSMPKGNIRSASASRGPQRPALVDMEAVTDELRADIAASRSMIRRLMAKV